MCQASDKFLAAIADVDVLVDETYYANPSTATIDAVLSKYGLTTADTQYRFIANKAVYRADKIVSDVFGKQLFYLQVYSGTSGLRFQYDPQAS
jgi:hypothetical protein